MGRGAFMPKITCNDEKKIKTFFFIVHLNKQLCKCEFYLLLFLFLFFLIASISSLR